MSQLQHRLAAQAISKQLYLHLHCSRHGLRRKESRSIIKYGVRTLTLLQLSKENYLQKKFPVDDDTITLLWINRMKHLPTDLRAFIIECPLVVSADR